VAAHLASHEKVPLKDLMQPGIEPGQEMEQTARFIQSLTELSRLTSEHILISTAVISAYTEELSGVSMMFPIKTK